MREGSCVGTDARRRKSEGKEEGERIEWGGE